ncbi:MAG: MFS transporter [Candidatus Thorarchaeota archaeon]|jgi:MFS family permease
MARDKSDCLLRTETIQAMAGAATLSAFTYVPILARDYLNADELFITLLVGTFAAASFIASYIFGRAGDIYGRRIVIRIGLLTATISFGLLMFVQSLDVLLIVRTLGGFSIGMYPGALAAYAFESDMKMGRFASFGAAGWGIGTLLAGFAAGYNIYFAFLMSTVFLIIAFASAMTLPYFERTRIHVPLFPIETLKRNWSVYTAVLIRHSTASAIWTLWPLFLTDLGGDPFSIGIVQVSNAIPQVIVMIAITDRFDCRFLISVGMISSAITFYWFTLATSILEVIPTQFLLGFSWACLYVGALKYVTERNADRSTASGLLTSVLSLSMVLGPIMAAVIYSIWPAYIPIMYNAVVFSLVGYAIFLVASRREVANELATENMK